MDSDFTYPRFIEWLSRKLRTVRVNLRIPKSHRNSKLIDARVEGIEAVLDLYSWKATWTAESGRSVRSEDWASTKESIRVLSENVRFFCSSNTSTDQDVFEACKQILTWGGERDGHKGASRFLSALMTEGRLKEYLRDAREAFRLDSRNGPSMGQLTEMNSMLSKVHAFLADDGLPIYDSRVASTAASLVEIYRREIKAICICPEELSFPAVGGGGERRSVKRLFPDCQNARALRYGQNNIAFEWARAKWHLGRVIRDVLESDPRLFANEGDSFARAHALEASLFMIGYDVHSLA